LLLFKCENCLKKLIQLRSKVFCGPKKRDNAVFGTSFWWKLESDAEGSPFNHFASFLLLLLLFFPFLHCFLSGIQVKIMGNNGCRESKLNGKKNLWMDGDEKLRIQSL